MSHLWNRLRDARLPRALAVFCASGWVALQVAAFTIDRFGFPGWTLKLAVALLAIGLVVIVATAWFKTRVARSEAEGQAAPGGLRQFTWRRAAAGGALAFLVLFGLAGLWVVIQDRGRAFAPDEAMAEAAPAVAVLPFEAAGEGLESWREGAIDLISTNLDGAGGLRAIDSRTVLARWSEGVKEGDRPDVDTALAVARRTGARYAVLGNVVALGAGIRLTADVHRLDGGQKLGTAQVEGAADSVYTLVDRLSIDILRLILGRSEEFPRVELARATTASLPALRAYLEGESHFRRADFRPAISAYQQAVEADSTFALAWRRLGESIGWLPFEVQPEGGPYPAAVQAARYADRLPEREAIAVRAYLGFIHGTFRPVLEPLRTATRRFPDDPELIFLLAEIYVHMGEQVPVGDEETDRALRRVLELDPTFAPYYQHPIEGAFLQADSARALALLERYEALAGDNREARGYRLAATLAWGTSEAKAAARAALDTLPPDELPGVELRHPRFVAENEAVSRALLEADRGAAAANILLAQGRVSAARQALELNSQAWRLPGMLYLARLVGVPLDEARLREISVSAPDTLFPEAVYAGILAAEEGDADRVARMNRRARAYADTLRAEGDTLTAISVDGVARGLEGYLRYRQRDPAGALPILLEAQRDATGWGPMTDFNEVLRLWIAEILMELERPEEALEWFVTFPVNQGWLHPYVALRAGAAYEALGRPKEAKDRYETALEYWRDAGPEMAEKVAEARAGLARLGFAPRG